jgi:Ca2+-binding EF-hand superfamily protein
MVVLREDLEKSKTWEAKWNKMDSNDQGMTPTKFARFLNEINSRLEKFECYEVFHKLDFKNKEVLTIYDIEDFLQDSKNTDIENPNTDNSKKNENNDNLEEMREAFAYRNIDGHNLFKHLDYNSDGLIPKRNFESILNSNKILNNNPKAVRQLCHFYQQPHTSLIDYNKLFKDMAALRPGKPLFANFLALDILAMTKNMRRNLKEMFLGQEASVGDYDGKMSLGEFGELVSRAWGESGEITMEKP